MKIFLKYFLPAALVAGFLCSFFYEATHYKLSLDDCYFDALTHNIGFTKSVIYNYEVANGRWFSHLIACGAFYWAGHHFTAYAFILSAMASLFILGISIAYKSYLFAFRNRQISFFESLKAGLVFTALVYFLQYTGRVETWFWLSSVTNHLLSVTLSLFLVAMVLKNSSMVQLFLIFILGVCVGGLNEINAICNALLLLFLFALSKYNLIHAKISGKPVFISVIGIAVSLVFNFLSQGYKIRMEGLPDFSLLQALKNTIHSALFILLDLKLIPLITLALVLLLLFAARKTNDLIHLLLKNKMLLLGLAGLISFSFFMHCYTLSDIIPARGALWGYTLFLFMIVSLLPSDYFFPSKTAFLNE